MNKLISRNVVERFKKKLHEGGNIPKLQTAWTPLSWNDPNLELNRRRAAILESTDRAVQPVARNNTALLQDALWKIGAFNGVKDRRNVSLSYETAVDGRRAKSGKGTTDLAIAWAKANGYDVDELNGIVTRSKTPISSRTIPSISNREEHPTLSYRYVSNLYPFGYSDEYGGTTLKGFLSKALGGLIGKSDAKVHSDAIIDLNLDDPKQYEEGMRHFNELSAYGRIINNIKDFLKTLRIREDANRLYTGMPQKYNTFMINPDWSYHVADAEGVPTYTFTDPELRKQYQLAGLGFNQTHGKGSYKTFDNLRKVFNRFRTVKANDDGSGFYAENWDLLGFNPTSKVYIADTIPANIGRRGRAFVEGQSDTPTGFIDFVTSSYKKSKEK